MGARGRDSGSARRIKQGDDTSLAEALDRRGIHGAFTDGVVRTFLSGVLGEDELRTSRRLGDLLVRSFVRGVPALPEGGMQAVPDQLARLLPAGVLRTSTAGTHRRRHVGRLRRRTVRGACGDRGDRCAGGRYACSAIPNRPRAR